jgi:hypothetical protein
MSYFLDTILILLDHDFNIDITNRIF